ncbi:hypothetical protein [Paraburkholderia sp. J11-2]|uniref:hypothetical protein n=1 Tax=Paraburkholderia sp. J11-2 TaxID=2805431 RepID=UPI002AB6D9BD|nr:hypothetical protein [Paraburkholderia sp. J11-2]
MTLDERLDNWAKAQRYADGCGGGRAASVYFAGGGGAVISSDIDLADARRVELAWRKLMPFAKALLKLHYMERQPSMVICRKLGIRARPPGAYDQALCQAKREIGGMLESEARAGMLANSDHTD